MNKIKIIKIAIVLVVILISLICWGRFMSTKGLVIKEYAIKTDKLDDSFDGFKIVHFSDLHFGSTIYFEELIKI